MESPLPPNPYVALGVPNDADTSVIKSTYKKLALKYHPDKVADESKKAEATEKFHKIQRAYDIIGDEEERARYDAQVKLTELRRQDLDLRGPGPRVDARTAGFDIRTAAPQYSTAFPTRVSTRVYTENRRPTFSYDEDEPQRGSSRKFDYTHTYTHTYTKRSPPKEKEKEEKRERVRVSDEERKRAEKERRRDADMRESRSRKHAAYVVDEEYERIETERRQRDKEEEVRRKEETPRRGSFRGEEMYEDERKYADAKRYMAAQSRTEDVRSTTYRVPSSREVPYAHVRRTTASPETTRRSPPRTSAPTSQGQNASSKENLHPPTRSRTTQTDFDSRKQAENDPPPPSRGRTTETTAQPDSAYASATSPETRYKQYSPPPPPPPPQAQPSTSYAYPKQTAGENPTPRTESGIKYATSTSYRVEIREPGSSSRRVPSPQREREAKPSTTAAKWAHLVGTSSRAHASTYPPFSDTPSGRPPIVQQSSNRSIPRLSRSPEPISERVRERERERRYEQDRSRDRDRRQERLYGEINSGYVRSTQINSSVEDGVQYSRRPRQEDVIYSSRGRRGSRDGPYYDDQRPPPQFSRSATMPAVYAGA